MPAVVVHKKPNHLEDRKEHIAEELNKVKIEESECGSHANSKENIFAEQSKCATIKQSGVFGLLPLIKSNFKTVPDHNTSQRGKTFINMQNMKHTKNSLLFVSAAYYA